MLFRRPLVSCLAVLALTLTARATPADIAAIDPSAAIHPLDLFSGRLDVQPVTHPRRR